MKLAVIGSRTFKDKALLEKTLASVKTPITLLISGGAIGADTLAQEWAQRNGIATQIFKPDYTAYGKRAPLERNLLIVAAADNVLAFHDGESTGTKHALRHANKLGRPSHVVNFSIEKPAAPKKKSALRGNLDGFARCPCPEPDSPQFDSTKHGLLAPPKTTTRTVKIK